VNNCHIHTGLIQRSQKRTALGRLAYQSCDYFDDGFRKADYRPYSDAHFGHVILLPDGAPPEFAQAEDFLMAVAFREHRKDAQEGRTLDFAIPRAVPQHLLLAVAAFAVQPFAALGMAIRVDVECPRASDGELNPHGHCYLAQRRLESDGFGPKQPQWNVLFRRDSGRHFRALIASRLTLACAILGIEAHVDPRRNDEIGVGKPEVRLAPVLWRIREEGGSVQAIDELRTQRLLKSKLSAPGCQGPDPRGWVSVASPVSFPGNRTRAAAALKVVTDFAQRAELDIERLLDTTNSYLTPLRLGRTAVTFDGQAFRLKGNGGTRDAALIVELARELEWPALVVEGDTELADQIILAGAAIGLTAVNRAASTAVLRLISETQLKNFLDQIAQYDPLGVVADLLSSHVPPTSAGEVAINTDETLEIKPPPPGSHRLESKPTVTRAAKENDHALKVLDIIKRARTCCERLPEPNVSTATLEGHRQTLALMLRERELDPLRPGIARDTYNHRRAALRTAGRHWLMERVERCISAGQRKDAAEARLWADELLQALALIEPALSSDPPLRPSASECRLRELAEARSPQAVAEEEPAQFRM
jgi:hypothetical protein